MMTWMPVPVMPQADLPSPAAQTLPGAAATTGKLCQVDETSRVPLM